MQKYMYNVTELKNLIKSKKLVRNKLNIFNLYNNSIINKYNNLIVIPLEGLPSSYLQILRTNFKKYGICLLKLKNAYILKEVLCLNLQVYSTSKEIPYTGAVLILNLPILYINDKKMLNYLLTLLVLPESYQPLFVFKQLHNTIVIKSKKQLENLLIFDTLKLSLNLNGIKIICVNFSKVAIIYIYLLLHILKNKINKN